MTTLYFNNAVDKHPETLGNFWTDSGCSVAASGLPVWSADTVHVVSGAEIESAAGHLLALLAGGTLVIDSGGLLTVAADTTVLGALTVTGTAVVATGKTLTLGATAAATGAGTLTATGTLVLLSGATCSLSSGGTLTIAGAGISSGSLTIPSGATLSISSGKTLTLNSGSTTTIGGTLSGAGTLYPMLGATLTVAGLTVTGSPAVAVSNSKIDIAIQYATQCQAATRLPAKSSAGDYDQAELAAALKARITGLAQVAAARYQDGSGDTTAIATLESEFQTLILDGVKVSCAAMVTEANGVTF